MAAQKAEDGMKRATFRYVEAELYDYPHTKAAIEELRDDIIESGVRLEQAALATRVQSNRHADPTEAKGVRLLTNRRLRRMEETVQAIERVWARLPEEKRRLVELKYWDGRYNDRGVMQRLSVSDSTYYRWRRGIIHAVAMELGLTNTVDIEGAVAG